MNSTFRSIIVCLTLLFSSLPFVAMTQPDPNFELYILIGQSNMAGRGPMTAALKAEGNDSLFTFNKDRQWVLARHPLHFDKPAVVGVGPGLAFGIEMAKANPGKRIGLIPCAVGGSPIEHWLPGAYDSATNTHPYDDAAERILIAMKWGVVKGVCWHQGESNSQPGKATQYLTQLTALIARIRELTGNPRLPFVAGELGRFLKTADNINQQLALLPKLVPFTAVVSAEGLADKGDQLHFDAASANELGKRYAQNMEALQR